MSQPRKAIGSQWPHRTHMVFSCVHLVVSRVL